MADNKSTYSSLMNELVDTINEKANSSDSKNLEELVAIAKTIVKPEGTLEITENKQYDVSGYALANVNVASSGGEEVRSLKKVLDINKSSYRLFYGVGDIDVNEYLEYSDTSNVTNMRDMFMSSRIRVIPLFDTSSNTTMQEMFNGCTNLTSVALLNTSNVNTMQSAFYKCSKLTTIPAFDTSKVGMMASTFESCTALTSVPALNTSNVYSFYGTFNGCTNLITVNGLNMIKASTVSSMFNKCTNLTNLTLYNIKINLTVGSGTSYGHLLTIESLLNTCQECINVNAARTLTVGSANITKLSSVYVKLTNEPEADSTLPKLPMVQCESTDEGAMLVADYMALKQWSLA